MMLRNGLGRTCQLTHGIMIAHCGFLGGTAAGDRYKEEARANAARIFESGQLFRQVESSSDDDDLEGGWMTAGEINALHHARWLQPLDFLRADQPILLVSPENCRDYALQRLEPLSPRAY